MKLAAETWYQKQIEKGSEIKEGKIEIRKECVCQQGYSSKVLVIYCTSPESEKMDIKITKMQMWTGKHTKHVSFKKTESKVKLGTLHFNNMKNIAGRYEALFDINAMDRVQAGNKTCTAKDYLMELKSADSKLFVAVEQGSGNM